MFLRLNPTAVLDRACGAFGSDDHNAATVCTSINSGSCTRRSTISNVLGG
jgi:hypothetical protein